MNPTAIHKRPYGHRNHTDDEVDWTVSLALRQRGTMEENRRNSLTICLSQVQFPQLRKQMQIRELSHPGVHRQIQLGQSVELLKDCVAQQQFGRDRVKTAVAELQAEQMSWWIRQKLSSQRLGQILKVEAGEVHAVGSKPQGGKASGHVLGTQKGLKVDNLGFTILHRGLVEFLRQNRK